jgi:tetratricopeptide (TPR) repeat protein
VFTGEIGTIHRRTYTVMGDAVNLAARLMAKAVGGQILVTEPVLGSSRTLFETDRLEPFAVKGKRQPVTALALGSPRGVRAGIASSTLPLVGRDEELKTVVAMIDSLHLGSGCLLEVTGDPGVGKSRFIDEVVARAGTVRVHRVQCRQYQVDTPYFAFHDLLRQLLGLVGKSDDQALAELARIVASSAPSLTPWVSLIAMPLALDEEPSPEVAQLAEAFRRQQLERSVVELLASVITEPTIICFEDTHWLDEASGDLLRALEREVARRPWLLCVTRRAVVAGFASEPGPHTLKVNLNALGSESTADLLKAATAGEPLPEFLVRALAERSDGNPLFALELLHAYRAQGDIDALPESVEALIAARIDRLPAADRTVLRQVAVLGAGFWARDIAAVLPGTDSPPPTVSLAPLGDLLEVRQSGWVTFRHALVRDVAYSQLPFSVRSRLHGRVAESILSATIDDTGEQAALLSLHFAYAHRHEEAWRYARRAGDSAREIYANIEAITFYRRALQAARHLPEVSDAETADTFERMGDVQELAGLYDDSRASYRAARRLLSDEPIRNAGLWLKDAFILERQGGYRQAVRSVRRGQRLLDGVSGREAEALRSQLTIWYAVLRLDQGNPGEGARWGRVGVSLAESLGDRATLARGYLVLDIAEATLGLLDGRPYTERALAIYTELGDLSGQAVAANNLGVHGYNKGRWLEAIELYERARAARMKTGDPVNAAMADANVGEIRAGQGRLDEAEVLWCAARDVWTAARDRWGVAFATRGLGVVAARAGRFDDAATLLERARVDFLAIGAHADVMSVDISIAERLVLAGDGAEALLVLGRLIGDDTMLVGLEHRLPELHLWRALARLQAGETERGRGDLETAVAVARRKDSRYHLALALEALEAVDGAGVGVNEDARSEYVELYDLLGVIARPKYPLSLGAQDVCRSEATASARQWRDAVGEHDETEE